MFTTGLEYVLNIVSEIHTLDGVCVVQQLCHSKCRKLQEETKQKL